MTSPTAAVNAVHIPDEPNMPAANGPMDVSPSGLWDFLHGQPEIVPLGDAGAVVHINAYGKTSKTLTANPRATRLIDAYVPGFAAQDMVMGPAVVTGIDHNGLLSDIPEDVATAALRA